MTPEALLADVTFDATSLEQVPFDRLRATLAERSIVRVRGLFAHLDLDRKMAAIADRFDPRADRKHDPRDTEAVRTNFQKLQIGANSGTSSRRTLGRFLRILFNPIFAPDVYALRELFVTLAQFRNGLYRLPRDFAVHGTDEGFWSCARLHQYPRGGGFMVPHRDLYAQLVTDDANLGYYQPLVILSRPGVDYVEGGAYIEIGEERVVFESACQRGDLVVYDGRTMHGVADIDPLRPLELDSFGGRVAAFASLFRHFTDGGADYEKVAAKAVERYGARAEKI